MPIITLYRLPFIFIVSLTLIIYTGCTQNPKIKIALMTKLEAGSSIGMSEYCAVELFLNENNNRELFDIQVFDDKWDPARSKYIYSDIINKNISILITSHTSSCAIELIDQINADKILTLSTGATTTLLSKHDDFLFRVIPDLYYEQTQIALWAKSTHKSRILVIKDTDNTAYTDLAHSIFSEKIGQEITTIDISISKWVNKDIETKLIGQSYDLVYLLIGGYNYTAGTIAQLIKKYNPSIKILYTPWMMTPSLENTTGDSLEQSVIPSMFPPREINKKVDAYIAKFFGIYKKIPTRASLNVYESLNIIRQAVIKGLKTSEEIRLFLKNRTIKGPFADIVFDEFGDSERPYFFLNDIRSEFKTLDHRNY